MLAAMRAISDRASPRRRRRRLAAATRRCAACLRPREGMKITERTYELIGDQENPGRPGQGAEKSLAINEMTTALHSWAASRSWRAALRAALQAAW